MTEKVPFDDAIELYYPEVIELVSGPSGDEIIHIDDDGSVYYL